MRIGFPVAESESTDDLSGHRGCPVTPGRMLDEAGIEPTAPSHPRIILPSWGE